MAAHVGLEAARIVPLERFRLARATGQNPIIIIFIGGVLLGRNHRGRTTPSQGQARPGQMSFAEAAGEIAGRLKDLLERIQFGLRNRRITIVQRSGGAGEQAGHERSARRHANRILAIGAGEAHAFGRQLVQIGSLHNRMTGHAQHIGIVLVGK